MGKRATLEVRLLAARFTVAAILFALAVILGVAFPSLTARAPWLTRGIFVFSWLVAGYRVALNSLRNILKGEVFDENFLMTVATVGAFAIGQWSEGAAVMLFYNLGEMVQESAVNRSRRSIADLMDVRPDSARLDADGSVVSPQAVPVGALIRVLPGEKVPLDGLVVEGSSCFDTSRLTGESVPRDVGQGSEALAGFVNGSGLLVIRTTAVYEKTAAAKMLALIEGAQNRKARAEKLITTFARVYTPIVTIGAVLPRARTACCSLSRGRRALPRLGRVCAVGIAGSRVPRHLLPLRLRHLRAAWLFRRDRRCRARGHTREGRGLYRRARQGESRRLR